MNSAQKGNSLLIVIVFMALLSALVMSAYTIVQRQIGQQQTYLYGQQSYYAAEAATEVALLRMKGHLPGFEGTLTSRALEPTTLRRGLELPVSLQQAYFEFAIRNRSSKLPVTNEPSLTLLPQIPRSIPLFQDEAALESSDVSIKDFTGSFYFQYDTPPEQPIYSPQVPCIRWDISGFAKGTQDTESIGGILPCSDRNLDSSLTTGQDSITTFLQQHTQSYLTLTNLLSNTTPLFGELTTQPSTATVGRPFATIEATGRVCHTTDLLSCVALQAIDTMLPQGQILPIFSYTIFQ